MDQITFMLMADGGGLGPPSSSREQVISIKTNFQGYQVGEGRVWEPEIASFNPMTRESVWAAKRQAGHTHVVLTLDKRGLGSLPDILAIMHEALDNGFYTLLFCMGDGNDPGEHDHDEGALGFSWLMANFAAIHDAVEQQGLKPTTVFCPGFDGVVPAWQPWARVNDFANHARQILGPSGYLALEMSAGYGHSWSGEQDDFGTPDGQCFDVVLCEFPIDIGPPDDPAPADFCNQSNDGRARWDQVWQISKRVLGPLWNRPAGMPACDDSGSYGGGPSVHQTPRGPFAVVAFEYDTFEYVRLGRLNDLDVQRHRDYFVSLGWPLVC